MEANDPEVALQIQRTVLLHAATMRNRLQEERDLLEDYNNHHHDLKHSSHSQFGKTVMAQAKLMKEEDPSAGDQRASMRDSLYPTPSPIELKQSSVGLNLSLTKQSGAALAARLSTVKAVAAAKAAEERRISIGMSDPSSSSLINNRRLWRMLKTNVGSGLSVRGSTAHAFHHLHHATPDDIQEDSDEEPQTPKTPKHGAPLELTQQRTRSDTTKEKCVPFIASHSVT
jgi:hypothetical protein